MNHHARNFLAWVIAFGAAAVLFPVLGPAACLAGVGVFFLVTALVKRK